MPGWITIRTLRPRDQPPLQRRHLFKFDGGADHFGEKRCMEQGLFPYLFPPNKGAWDDEHSPWKWTEINVMGQLLKSFAMAVSFRTPQLHAQLTSRITQTAWSIFVLRYAMKAEPTGLLVIDKDAMSQLGLQRMDAVHLENASALIFSK
ncbi:MAG: hypothetical protein FRX49_10728 [Trebouxia sp. A1-2]|nr:MAG: hypothetical protein FRX49_10728 [Trebouxia sp. A1-2]